MTSKEQNNRLGLWIGIALVLLILADSCHLSWIAKDIERIRIAVESQVE